MFSHVALSCADPLATERFYTRYFGFVRARVIPLGGDDQIVFLKAGSVYLELFRAEGTSPVGAAEGDGPHYPGIRHIAFQVASVDEQIAKMGDDAKPTLGPLAFDAFIPGWKTLWVRDPDGNIVEISEGFSDQPDVPPLAS